MVAQVRRTHNYGWGCGPLPLAAASLGSSKSFYFDIDVHYFLQFSEKAKREMVEGASSEYCCTLMSKLENSTARVCRSSSRPLQKAFWWKFACKHSVGLLAAAAQSPRLWQKLGTHSFLEFLPTAAEAGPGWPLVAVVRCWRRPGVFLSIDHNIVCILPLLQWHLHCIFCCILYVQCVLFNLFMKVMLIPSENIKSWLDLKLFMMIWWV